MEEDEAYHGQPGMTTFALCRETSIADCWRDSKILNIRLERGAITPTLSTMPAIMATATANTATPTFVRRGGPETEP